MNKELCEGFELFVMKTDLVEPLRLLGNFVAEKVVARLVSTSQHPEKEILARAKRLEWIYEFFSAPAYDGVDDPAARGKDMHLYAPIQDRVNGSVELP
jgi:hypothetical protein